MRLLQQECQEKIFFCQFTHTFVFLNFLKTIRFPLPFPPLSSIHDFYQFRNPLSLKVGGGIIDNEFQSLGTNAGRGMYNPEDLVYKKNYDGLSSEEA